MTGNSSPYRTRGPMEPRAAAVARTPTITAESARLDKLDADHFEAKARENLMPTKVRPALINQAEVDHIRTQYSTGAGRLQVIAKVTGIRQDYYTEATGGGGPFDPISDADRAKCLKWFDENGTRLLDEPRLAPPNPIRAKDEPEKMLADAKVDPATAARLAAEAQHPG